MTHIMIEDSSPEGKWLLELIRNHKSVTVINGADAESVKASPWDKALAEGAVSLNEFGTRLTDEIHKAYQE